MRTVDDQTTQVPNTVYNLNRGELDFDTFLNLYSTPQNNFERVKPKEFT